MPPIHRSGLCRARREFNQSLLATLAPRTCAACGEVSAAGLCPGCRARLEVVTEPRCRRCRAALLHPTAVCTADHSWLRWIHAVYAPWFYRGSGGAIVRRFKFEGCPVAGERMLHAMRRALGGFANGEGRRAKVVAVPMHRQRRRERGYDQAERLAIGLGDLLGLSYQDGVLVRRRATLSQADPRVTSREANVAGAFQLARPAAVQGSWILLVDDVCTSGATARACAAVLRGGGAQRVALVVAALAHPERADPDLVS